MARRICTNQHGETMLTSSNARTILHVDDDDSILRLVAKRLTEHDFRVVSLNDPTRAIDEIVQRQIRVALLDIAMPARSGIDVLRDIKDFDGGIQVLMLTGIVTVSSVLKTFRFGAEACFFKPMTDFEPLVSALNDTFRKIDRWWNTLQILAHQRRELEQLAEI